MTHNADTARADLRHLPPEDRAWLATLAGLPGDGAAQPPATPPDGDAAMIHAQARQLRHYFTQRDALEAATPLGSDSEARMLARLHRLGAFQPAAATTAPAPRLQRLRAVLDWLLPSGPRANGRYALIAGIALAVMVVPVLLRQGPDDAYKAGPALGKGTQLMLVTQPAQQLQQLQNALQAAGVAAQAQPHERGYLLQARIAPAQRAAVQNALSPWGLLVPTQGSLAVSIQPAGLP